MSARIHVFVTKEMKLPVMLVENYHRCPTPSWRPHLIGRRRGLPLIGEDSHLLRESPYPLAVLIGPEASQG
jgi:hypothetical protein